MRKVTVKDIVEELELEVVSGKTISNVQSVPK